MVEVSKELPGWLLRDTDNTVRGPFTKTQVLAMVKSGELKGRAELAAANSYWFYLDETGMLEQFFPELASPGAKKLQERTKTLTQVGEPRPAIPPQDGTPSGGSELGATTVLSSEELASLSSKGEKTAPNIKRPDFVPIPGPAKQEAPAPQAKTSAFQRSPKAFILAGAASLVLVGALVWTSLQTSEKPVSQDPLDSPSGVAEHNMPRGGIAEGLLLSEYDMVQGAILELEKNAKTDPAVSIAKALLKGRFLFDSDGALSLLEYAKGLAKQKPKQLGEVENLLGIYSITGDPNFSLERFRAAIQLDPQDRTFRYNFGLGQLLTRRAQGAEQIFSELARSTQSDDPLAADVLIGLGLAAESTRSGSDTSVEQYYRKSLELDPASVEGRILLAQRLLRRGDAAEADAQFRIFIDSLPEIDGQVNLQSYRKLSRLNFFDRARSLLRETETILRNSNTAVSPVVLSADALLTALVGQYTDAEQILSQALAMAPGSPEPVKVLAYVRFREGKDAEVLDLISSRVKEAQDSYAFNLLMGKALARQGKFQLAARHFQQMANKSPDRSDGWALLGEATLASGNDKDATKYFQTALEKNPANLRAMRGLARLGKLDHLARPYYKAQLPAL